jgi:large subunit ribosomal protein L6
MSKIGKQPIVIPEGVFLNRDGRTVVIKGPKGELSQDIPRFIDIEQPDEGVVVVKAKSSSKIAKSMHGTVRALLSNMIRGVTEGWSKKLEIVGTGYRAETDGQKIKLAVGFSHPVEIDAPEGISFSVEKSVIKIEGVDKQRVGEVAAKIRGVRPPEPYKGKGIKYENEIVRRKAGKAAKATGAA